MRILKGFIVVMILALSLAAFASEQKPEMRIYDVSDLTSEILDCPSADIPADTLFTPEALAKVLGPQGTAAALAAPRFVCSNGQRMGVISSHAHTYIADHEATAGSMVPKLRQILEGVFLDATPVLSH